MIPIRSTIGIILSIFETEIGYFEDSIAKKW